MLLNVSLAPGPTAWGCQLMVCLLPASAQPACLQAAAAGHAGQRPAVHALQQLWSFSLAAAAHFLRAAQQGSCQQCALLLVFGHQLLLNSHVTACCTWSLESAVKPAAAGAAAAPAGAAVTAALSALLPPLMQMHALFEAQPGYVMQLCCWFVGTEGADCCWCNFVVK
jgi:hypothetical protein